MNQLILWVGNAAALLGMILCAITAVYRVSGAYTLGGTELGTLFTAGIGLMVFACLAKLHLLSQR